MHAQQLVFSCTIFTLNISYFRRLQSFSTRPTTYTSWSRRRRDFCRKTVSWSGWWASKRVSCWARPACTRNAKSTTLPVSTRWRHLWGGSGGERIAYKRPWRVVIRFVVNRRGERVNDARQGSSTCRLLRLYFYILLFSTAPFKLRIILLHLHIYRDVARTNSLLLHTVCMVVLQVFTRKKIALSLLYVSCVRSCLLLLLLYIILCESEWETAITAWARCFYCYYILFLGFSPRNFYCVFLVFRCVYSIL